MAVPRAAHVSSSASGIGAPPTTARRRLDRSARAKPGSCARKRYVAGTPIIVVTRFSSISRSARSGSNWRSRTTVAPFHHASSACTFHPPTWNCGSTCSTTSSCEIPVVRSKPRFVQKQFACVSSAPFGLPVVPEV